MGIWDYVSSATESISGGVTRSREIVGGAAGKARETAIWTSQVVVERMPDQEGRQKIGRLGAILAEHAIDKGTRPYTGGIPVYGFVKEALSNNQENTELAKLKAKVENLEKKLEENNQNSIYKSEGW